MGKALGGSYPCACRRSRRLNYFAQFDPPAGPATPAKPGSGNSIEDQKNWITITGEKAYFSQTYSFKTPPGNLNCVDVSFWGFIK